MQPVQVDVVGLQPAERLLAGRHHGLARAASAVGVARVHIAEELGGDHEPVPLGLILADVVADDLLGVALGVDVRGVEEVPAALDVGVHDPVGLIHIRPPTPILAEGHGAKAQG